MTHHKTNFAKTIFLMTSLALGCTSSGTLGCSGSGGEAPTVDSELLGIYRVDRYQGSEAGCDQLTDLDGAPRLALYSLPSASDPNATLLVGQFCGSVEDCGQRVKNRPTAANYSFFEGSDGPGWLGWGLASEGMVGDQCKVDIQTHTLTSPSDQAIRIDTKQVETEFAPMVPEGSTEATCKFRDAIASIDDNDPCKALFLLEATWEAPL